MEQITEFITNHLVLSTLFVVLSGLLIRSMLTDLKQGGTSLEASGATLMLNRENAVMLDIRTAADFSEGHVINAINIPFSEFDRRTADLEKLRDRPVIVCCKTGTSASQSVASLKKLGFEKTYRLKGGIEGWKQSNLPLAT